MAKRFLLITVALSSAAGEGCGKERGTEPGGASGTEMRDAGEPLPLPANPKGSFYDAGLISPVDGTAVPTAASEDGGTIPKTRGYPANPKGSHYDAPQPEPPPTEKPKPKAKLKPKPKDPVGEF